MLYPSLIIVGVTLSSARGVASSAAPPANIGIRCILGSASMGGDQVSLDMDFVQVTQASSLVDSSIPLVDRYPM
jgi:hypothetical protein